MRKANGGEVVKHFLLLLIAATAAFAAVDGVIINGTTDKPQEGAIVTLYQIGNAGPQQVATAKTGADGKFAFTENVQAGVGGGPLLLQAIYGGVLYNKMLPPGMPSTGAQIPVFESSKTPGDARLDQHMILLEPAASGEMRVTETWMYKNDGKTTWNDPQRGTLQFALPAAAQGKVDINVLSPGGMPLRRTADPGSQPNTFKLDFPVKPGESRVDMTWMMPFNSPGVFENKVLVKGGALRMVTPPSVTVQGPDVQLIGTEPTTKASVYNIKGPDIKVNVQGTGTLSEATQDPGQQAGDQGGEQNNSGGLTENLPKLYGLAMGNSDMLDALLAVKWVLAAILAMLAIGFVLLYRKDDDERGRR